MTMVSLLLVFAAAAMLLLALVGSGTERMTWLMLSVSSSAVGLLLVWMASRLQAGADATSDRSRAGDEDTSPSLSLDDFGWPVEQDERTRGALDSRSRSVRSGSTRGAGDDGLGG
jgi:hypothetical protein